MIGFVIRRMAATPRGMTETIAIIADAPRVEALLAPYRVQMGADYRPYRNHVLRVLSYAMHFLEGDAAARPVVETALAFHDIGLWSAGALGYLEPSIAEALAANAREGWGFDPEQLRAMITEHHKLTRYRGPHARLVEAVRRADWIDASGGLRRMGLTRAQIAAVTEAIPVEGFPDVLMRLAGDLAGGNRVLGLWRVVTRVYRL